MSTFDESTGGMSSDDTSSDALRNAAGLVLVHASPVGSAPRAISLDERGVILGREPPPGGVAIRQTAVSRVHASVRRLPNGDIAVSDLGSRNGTFLDGERIASPSTATHGSVIRVGDALFVAARRDVSADLDYDLRGAPSRPEVAPHPEGLVGGASMASLSRTLRSFARTDASVLVTGETGVGKEVTARALHAWSGRTGPFKAINCAAVPAHLVESELFGHERGAFSGAVRAHEGIVRSAHMGTLLLDEIGDMSLDAQAKVLRVLETREVLPVGGTRPVAVDIRVLCATHRDLAAAIRTGAFRADLYARIAHRTVEVPPLRSRKEDIYAIAVRYLASRGRHTEPSVSFIHRLLVHDWPFNVRELLSALAYAVDMAGDDELRAAHLPASVTAKVVAAAVPGSADASPSSPAVDAAPARARRAGPTREELSSLLAQERGNMLAVARVLDRDPAQVYRWVRKFALDPEDFR